MASIGYARVSTREQDLLTIQIENLTQAGCARIFSEKVTGSHAARPQLRAMLDYIRAGDVVVVARLDRLARSTLDLLNIAEKLKESGAGLRSLAESWADTTSPAGGVMLLTILAGVAQFERSLIVSRTSAGRKAALARGVRFGRIPKISTESVEMARAARANGQSVSELANTLGVHKSTLFRHLKTSS